MDTSEAMLLLQSTSSSEPVSTKQNNWRSDAIAVAGLFLLVLAMFIDVLLAGQSCILSESAADVAAHFARWRAFGFGELSRGNLPLWNPHLFCGSPYVGGFQSAMFYPPNLLHLILPNTIAINWLIVSHVFLCGLWMYVWARSKELSHPASFLAGSLYMFAGSNFMHIYAGHLPIIYSAPWIPLLFWSLDAFLKTRSLGSSLVTILVATLEILAGHPQTVFYTAIAAGLYVFFHLFKAQRRILVLAGWAGMCVLILGLTAVQLWTGWDAVAENVRSQGGFAYAAIFSLPPENFLTLLVPGILGDNIHVPYWGRCHLWEMCLFIGITGIVLTFYAAIRGPKQQRRFLAPTAAIILILALGAHTPLFEILYNHVPGFNTFRGNSKFSLQACLFLTLLSGIGVDQLFARVRRTPGRRPLLFPLLVSLLALILAIAGIIVHQANVAGVSPWWQRIVQSIPDLGEAYLLNKYYSDLNFIRDAGRLAANSLLVASGTSLLLAVLLFIAGRSRGAVYAVLALAVMEIFVFARMERATFNPLVESTTRREIREFLQKQKPDDYRILNLLDKNSAMHLNAKDIWGYDPSVSLRYAELMTHTQGGCMDTVSQYVVFSRRCQLYEMLRLRYVFFPGPTVNDVLVDERPRQLPPIVLLSDFTIATHRDEIFAIMDSLTFDPEKQVVLERLPNPAPVPSKSPGTAKILDSGTDHLTIEADVSQPTILLVTDGYSKDWRVQPLAGSAQQQYDLMPANYVLRAVPLSAGHHIFRMVYAPPGFTRGKWISLASLAVYLAMVTWWVRKKIRTPRCATTSSTCNGRKA